MHWEIKNAHLVLEDGVMPGGGMAIRKNKIEQLLKKGQTTGSAVQLDLDGMFVYPGLVNGHDHLLGTYLPKVGDNRPYLNWLPWDNDLKSSPIYAERQRLDAAQLYKLGSYRHLINGVTAVNDHIPHFVQEPFVGEQPIKILTQFTMAHSICSFSLAWGKSIEEDHAKAVKEGLPFVTHCSEGFDEETKAAVSVLHEKKALSEHTVLIHGIAFSDDDIELLARKKVNVVWCPNSNLYMFNETTNIKGLLEAGVNVCLGTDSPMSGSVNMFDELRTARDFYRSKYGEELNPEILFQMVTMRAAKAFRVDNRMGSLEKGKEADFMVLDTRQSNPYKALVEGELKDVRLVVVDGLPAYGDKDMAPLFDALDVEFYNCTIDGQDKIANRDINALMDSVRESVGFKKELEFLPVD